MTEIVSVFGGSAPRPGEPAYEEAYTLGKLLGEAGYTVMTGGYAGTMEASSKGAKEAGAQVIGVTVGMFERAGHLPNDYVDDIVHYDTLSERLVHVVKAADAAIALPGGIGTLSEVALTWSLLQTGEVEPMPFVLLGEEWGRLLQTHYATGQYIREADMSLWQVARTPEQAVTLLRNWK